jgi:hypothetical protein
MPDPGQRAEFSWSPPPKSGCMLRDAMAQRTRMRRRDDLATALVADWDGVHSSLEHRYLRDVERPHALPRGIRQARARRGRRTQYGDVLYDEYAVAVELDGRAAHPGAAQSQP